MSLLLESGTKSSDSLKVSITTRFLEHFSEQLYSSPQKAFEELISNSWDAGANFVYVSIPDDLSAPNSSLCIYDNGQSMDFEGLQALWRIADSQKKSQTEICGRKPIGKFGIGKLATYVLADSLTYICLASDGVIRRVTMDYAGLSPDGSAILEDVLLEVYEVDRADVLRGLNEIPEAEEIARYISDPSSIPAVTDLENEFGGIHNPITRDGANTWTLVVLSNLKPAGRNIKTGILRRMLQAALPFGSFMAIHFSGERLQSSKANLPITQSWEIGPALGTDFTTLEVKFGDEVRSVSITAKDTPYPCLNVEGIGEVTGTVTLFRDKISGGKSENLGLSNGFFVNVRGRVVNLANPSFGEPNLSHAAWARFRAAVRADGLTEYLTISREQVQESFETATFKAFLRKLFNITRNHYDSDDQVRVNPGGALVRGLGPISLRPLRNVVIETLHGNEEYADLLKDNEEPSKEQLEEFVANSRQRLQNTLTEVKFGKLDNKALAQYSIHNSAIIVNKKHPFIEENSRTKAQKELLRIMGMVNFLTDCYTLEIGVEPEKHRQIREYREQLLRFHARTSKSSPRHIQSLIQEFQHLSSDSKGFEAVLHEVWRCLGFKVKELASNGEPEGIAMAHLVPTNVEQTDDEKVPPLYRFTYDAKTSKSPNAQTGNLTMASVAIHKKNHKADYAVIVAPGFQSGLADDCAELTEICLLDTSSIIKLLEYTYEFGAIPLTKLRDLFDLHKPEDTRAWVERLYAELKGSRKLPLEIFLKCVQKLESSSQESVAVSTITWLARNQFDFMNVSDADVEALVRGLEIIVPELIQLSDNQLFVNTTVRRLQAAIAQELDRLGNDEDDDLD